MTGLATELETARMNRKSWNDLLRELKDSLSMKFLEEKKEGFVEGAEGFLVDEVPEGEDNILIDKSSSSY